METPFFAIAIINDLNDVKKDKLHCTACNKHLGSAARSETRMRPHPMLRTLVCHLCHSFYNSGEFEKGDDGSELYCRWCGQGGQKCIRRNFGSTKIKEIESADDWKCFKCVPRPLWDLRALCWALMRYCDLQNRLAYTTVDPVLKEKYQQACAIDESMCCKDKKKKPIITYNRKKDQPEDTTKKLGELKLEGLKKSSEKSAELISKIPPTIQVKKFASINANETSLIDINRKAQKRPASPIKVKPNILKKPLPISPYIAPQPPPMKKIKISQPILIPNSMKVDKQFLRNKLSMPLGLPNQMPFNGYRGCIPNDNINLSLENLTQGLDMESVAALASVSFQNTNNNRDNVVCTPDLLLEPLCEVSEDNNDDDVQCITPVPIVTSKVDCPPPPPPLVPRPPNSLPDLSPNNIIQMTENDVTINAATGGLKFRIDPQTLSCKKMYRLPDGRIFAINPNPNMPGGYSATIVAITDAPKAPQQSTPPASVITRTPRIQKMTRRTSKTSNAGAKVNKGTDITVTRDCDMETPVEWYRYNLIDGIDALQYSLLRLQKLKREATTQFLRTRTVDEMRNLHSTLERVLNNSAARFHEIRENLNKGLKSYILKKSGSAVSEEDEEDDDDVEILPNADDNDDPIFIDENSIDSNKIESTSATSNDIDLFCNERIVTVDPNTSKIQSNDTYNTSECINVNKDDESNTVLLDSSTENDNAEEKLNEENILDISKQKDIENKLENSNCVENNETIEDDVNTNILERVCELSADENTNDESQIKIHTKRNDIETENVVNSCNDLNGQGQKHIENINVLKKKSANDLEDVDELCINKNENDTDELQTNSQTADEGQTNSQTTDEVLTKSIDKETDANDNKVEKEHEISNDNGVVMTSDVGEKEESNVNCDAQSSSSKVDDTDISDEIIEKLLGNEPDEDVVTDADGESILGN
ncbi:Transcriptional regulator ATRX [Eumeta japonica]|uniref:Transcriptional regulator ATRX n=1 Tax=Eumeta variegata TaxID=151549 RepID=A0A4C1V9B6_EUMVA|nr:Transcriptional regulator ATRX [Eumeta japonica]